MSDIGGDLDSAIHVVKEGHMCVHALVCATVQEEEKAEERTLNASRHKKGPSTKQTI